MENYLESLDSEWFNRRLTGVLVIVVITFAVLILRLLYLQVVEGSELRRQSEINSIRLRDIDAPRGLIYDRHGTMLVDNRPSFDLFIVPKDARPLGQTLEKLGRVLNQPADVLAERLAKSKKQGAYKPILLVEDIGRDLLAAVEVQRYDLPGVLVKVSPKRHYLFKNHAAHVVGYVGEINAKELAQEAYADCKSGDVIGKFGAEKAFESDLRGIRGGHQVKVNANAQIVRILKTVHAQAGEDIQLTIDHSLQQVAEHLLQGQAGAAVAVDPNNGEILVMASNPTFDPNDFVTGMSKDVWSGLINNPFRPLENKAIQAEYPPASTYKIVTTIAGLEEGVIDLETTHYCPGFYKFGNRVYRCWRRGGHGEVNVIQALERSCDVFYYKVGEALGVDRLAWYAKACGLGTATGVPIDGESPGLIPTAAWKRKRFKEAWQGGETLSIAIGQGFNLTTPLQMAMLTAAVANGGKRYKPIIVKSVSSANTGEIRTIEPEVIGRLPISEKTLALVRQGLWAVVNQAKGTAHGSRFADVPFSGKTGTAQVVGRKVVEESLESEGGEGKEEEIKLVYRDHAWFVAYGPSDYPQIAVAVIVEHGEHGSSAAAPVAREIIREYLKLPEDRLSKQLQVAVEERLAAAEALTDDETSHSNEDGGGSQEVVTEDSASQSDVDGGNAHDD
jgi:penicillin-binding protein 2